VWTAGELYIGGASVSRGYLGRPDLTADRFVPDPFGGEPGARLYRTGDLARYLPDGDVEFLGRVDDQVKFHGFRVELNEIRCALNGLAPVRDSVVTVARDGNGRDVMVAYYVSRHELEASQLREGLRASILEETMPNLFVHLKKLPLTLNGKINYAALPALEEARKMVKRVFVPPRNQTEEAMARIWAEVLGLEQVSIHDNFFELGGHSLLATRVISRQREALRVEIPLRSLFEAPTVASLAEAIERSRSQGELGGAAAGPILAEAMSIDVQLADLELLSDEQVDALLSSPVESDRQATSK
jgi:acyl carrier protein